MYKYAKDLPPINLSELDLREFINNDFPLIKFDHSLDTPYLKRDFNLDLVIWNLSDDNLDRTEKILRYVLNNFNKLFETAWTALYHHLRKVDHNAAEHTLEEFFTEQIDFDSPYYHIQLEMNCDHQDDGQARYCFVVSTVCSCNKWMISDDNMRVYMNGNKPCGFNTNNDDTQMNMSLEACGMFYGMGKMIDEYLDKMNQDGFQFAEPFNV